MYILDLLPLHLILIYAFIFGICIGSFLNVLSDRLSRDETMMGRSYCEKCKHKLSSKDLIPIFSFLSLKGRCRYCRTKLSYMYLLSEILTGLFFALTSFLYIHLISQQNRVIFLVYLAITACLIVIILADIKFHIIPDEIQIALFILAIMKIVITNFSLLNLGWTVLSGIIVMMPILLLFLGTKGRGMGFGDVKFTFIIGLLLGWAQGLLALYIGFISGALVGTYLIICRKTKMKSRIAFGPFLVLGTYIMLFYGEKLVSVVKQLYGF